MRHAKSDWDADYGSDHERPLNKRGVRSARVIGRLLASQGLTPDLVISSTAVRARSTAQLAAEAGNWASEIVLESLLYGAGTATVVGVAAAAPPVETLMLVGHQPTWSMVVSVLTGERAEMKTADVAVVDFDFDDWGNIAPSAGKLETVYQPAAYMGSEFDSD